MRKSVAERSVRTRCGVPVTWRIALSTCVPNDCPPSYRLNSGGKTFTGSAAAMNRGLRSSAARIRSPSCRATGWSSGNCTLFFALADWWPAVTRPSTQSARPASVDTAPPCSAVKISESAAAFRLSLKFFLKPEAEAHIRRPRGSRDQVASADTVEVELVVQI